MKEAHPHSIYPSNWSSNTQEDRAGYISLEKSPVYAATARTALDIAGLGDVVKVSLGRGWSVTGGRGHGLIVGCVCVGVDCGRELDVVHQEFEGDAQPPRSFEIRFGLYRSFKGESRRECYLRP